MNRREIIALFAGAAAWPPAARAQQAGRLPRIGILEALTESAGQARIEALRESLGRLGWRAGRNVRIDYRWGAIDPERGRASAAELMALAPDVIFVDSAPVVAAMREQSGSVPIVFIQAGDPVQGGLVESYARPGGNLTGFLQFEPTMSAKFLQLLKDIAPNVTHVAVMQFVHSTWRGDFAVIEAAARSYAVSVVPAIVRSDDEIERAMMTLAQEPNGGLICPPDSDTVLRSDLIVRLAGQYGLPGVYSIPSFVTGGGLLSYGVDTIDLYTRAAAYIDRILNGAKPRDLPVQAPAKFHLAINLRTAKALGLTVPPGLLVAADEVIE